MRKISILLALFVSAFAVTAIHEHRALESDTGFIVPAFYGQYSQQYANAVLAQQQWKARLRGSTLPKYQGIAVRQDNKAQQVSFHKEDRRQRLFSSILEQYKRSEDSYRKARLQSSALREKYRFGGIRPYTVRGTAPDYVRERLKI